jgi:hypothetical protein
LFISVLLLDVQLSEEEHWDLITQFNHCHMFVPVTSQYLNIQHHILWYFLFSMVLGDRWWYSLMILVELLIITV